MPPFPLPERALFQAHQDNMTAQGTFWRAPMPPVNLFNIPKSQQVRCGTTQPTLLTLYKVL